MGVAKIQVNLDASCPYFQLLLHKSVTYKCAGISCAR